MRKVYQSDFYLDSQRVQQIHKTQAQAEEVERQGKAEDLARRIEKWTPERQSILKLNAYRQGDAKILENMLLVLDTVPPTSERKVLLEIIWHAKGDGTGAFVSLKCLALHSQLSEGTVKAARTRLKDKGIISYKAGGASVLTEYIVHLYRLEKMRTSTHLKGNLRDRIVAEAASCAIPVGNYIEDILAKYIQQTDEENARKFAFEGKMKSVIQ